MTAPDPRPLLGADPAGDAFAVWWRTLVADHTITAEQVADRSRAYGLEVEVETMRRALEDDRASGTYGPPPAYP